MFLITSSEVREEFEALEKYVEINKEVDILEKNLKNKIVILKFQMKNGYTYDLAQNNIWPFMEYIKPHKLRIMVPPRFPKRPPILIWLTDIIHPNIIPFKREGVCADLFSPDGNYREWSKYSRGWPKIHMLPFIPKLVLTILKNPNPLSAFGNTPENIKAMKICKEYGFPKDLPLQTKTKRKRGLTRRLRTWKL